MTDMSPFLALHILHAVPASLLNRSDTGAIKKITYGGTPRVRVSSQSWKRAIRVKMRENAIDGGAFGVRTTRFPKLVAGVLATDHDMDEHRAAAVAVAVFTKLGLKVNEKTGNTLLSVFASEHLPARVAAAIAEHDTDIVFDEKKGITVPDLVLAAARAALDVDATVDLALFGRMLSDIPTGNVDAAVSVAHPMSVEPLALEADFFTAVDDAAAEGEAVSTILSTTDLAAPVLYRYISLDRRQLRRNLAAASTDPAVVEKLAVDAEASFVNWAIRTVPAAKQHSTAANTLPLLVLADTAPAVYSLADAFVAAIRSDNTAADAAERLLQQSARLRAETDAVTTAWAYTPTVTDGLDFTGTDRADTIADLITRIQR